MLGGVYVFTPTLDVITQVTHLVRPPPPIKYGTQSVEDQGLTAWSFVWKTLLDDLPKLHVRKFHEIHTKSAESNEIQGF